ncbi:hypothetical protein G6F65_021576 [Rhizopus arrhizus]|nr:hypothetical protein G6F65_021576 [Rhizopus arrhizus]
MGWSPGARCAAPSAANRWTTRPGRQGVGRLAIARQRQDAIGLDRGIVDLDAVSHRQVVVAVRLAEAGHGHHQQVADGRRDAARVGGHDHVAKGVAQERAVHLHLRQTAVGAQMVGRQRDRDPGHAGDLVLLGVDDVVGRHQV